MKTVILFILFLCLSSFSQINKEIAAELGLTELVEIDSIPDKYTGVIAVKAIYDVKSVRDTSVFTYPEGKKSGYIYRKYIRYDGETYIPTAIYRGRSKFKIKEEWREQTIYIFVTPKALITIQDQEKEYQYFASFVISVIDTEGGRYRKMLTRRI